MDKKVIFLLLAFALLYGCTAGQALVSSENIAHCENLTDLQKARCIRDLGIKNKEPGYCALVTSNDVLAKSEFRYLCYLDVAIASKDASMCDKFKGYGYNQGAIDSCYLNVAFATNDTNLCTKIQDTDWHYQCLAVTQMDKSLCKNMSYSTVCIEQINKILNGTENSSSLHLGS